MSALMGWGIILSMAFFFVKIDISSFSHAIIIVSISEMKVNFRLQKTQIAPNFITIQILNQGV